MNFIDFVILDDLERYVVICLDKIIFDYFLMGVDDDVMFYEDW